MKNIKLFLRRFFTKQRGVAMLIGLLLGIILAGIAWLISSDNRNDFFSGLLLNLAAGALEVPFIVSLIGYWKESAKKRKASRASELAMHSLQAADNRLTTQLAAIFGFNYRPKKVDGAEFQDFLSDYKIKSRKYLDAIDFENYHLVLSEAQVSTYFTVLKEVTNSLTESISLFGFVLEDDLKGAILELRQYASTVGDAIETFDTQNIKREEVGVQLIKASATWTRTYLSNIRSIIERED